MNHNHWCDSNHYESYFNVNEYNNSNRWLNKNSIGVTIMQMIFGL